jgi:hypothetical protein
MLKLSNAFQLLDNGYVLEIKGGGQSKNISNILIFFFKWQDTISSEHNNFRLEMVPFLNSPIIVIVGVHVCEIKFQKSILTL